MDLDGRLGHRLPDVPVHDVAAETVQDAALVVERIADVEVGNIDVPVLMCCQRLREARALLRRLPVPLRQESGLAEHSRLRMSSISANMGISSDVTKHRMMV